MKPMRQTSPHAIQGGILLILYLLTQWPLAFRSWSALVQSPDSFQSRERRRNTQNKTLCNHLESARSSSTYSRPQTLESSGCLSNTVPAKKHACQTTTYRRPAGTARAKIIIKPVPIFNNHSCLKGCTTSCKTPGQQESKTINCLQIL